MSRFDITRTNIAVERLIETTQDPRHLYLLHAYNRHRYLEMAGRYEEIFAPDMTVAHPVYHFNMLGETLTLEGAEAVKGVYAEWTASHQCIFYVESEKLAVSDDMIVSTSIMLQQTPGNVLAASGVDVDPEATYLVKSAEHMIWPYENGLLVGEDVWEYDATQRDVIALDPSEVLTAEQSGRLLAPLIKPLPAVNPFTSS
ncbi:hypothetical protein F0U44_19080 [Nocardioides humilatus]|uniref:Nuclear transport factor 2 family protein n=1 Tax=Nocardioides humilatus TaxID=2607660 RepID=A0A5B1L9I5_9ACTN|nr:hypothetical protein [Nocardioides humilatus]KAA1416419.1 hypothetical protein F0U44_19080 [Nocardioides humilatus]